MIRPPPRPTLFPYTPLFRSIVEQVRAANPQALFCCDPVIGDVDTGSYVTAGIAEFFRDRALAMADIITPNRFELEYLTGDRKSTRLNSSHLVISYAVFCLKN